MKGFKERLEERVEEIYCLSKARLTIYLIVVIIGFVRIIKLKIFFWLKLENMVLFFIHTYLLYCLMKRNSGRFWIFKKISEFMHIKSRVEFVYSKNYPVVIVQSKFERICLLILFEKIHNILEMIFFIL